MGMRQSPQTILAAALLIVAATGARAATPAQCAAYANAAVNQYYANKAIPGCFKGDDGRWHARYDDHYGWCVTADYGAVLAQQQYRDQALAGCQARAFGH